MVVVVAEKPSVARDLAAYLGATRKAEGYLEGNGYQVTWAYGHLVQLKTPDEYDPALKTWKLETLPFIPDRFELTVVPEAHGRQQFQIVKRLLRGATELICATDAGREGELIFRYIQQLAGVTAKPWRRLWLSSLTRQAIDAAWQAMRPGHDYDRLFAAARCRSEADWIVGLNATRNYTVRHGRSSGVLWSVGRVQTPVLAMIVRRDDEIRTFRPVPFWELRTVYRGVLFRYRGDRFVDEAKARELLARVTGQLLAIAGIDRQKQSSAPPQLFDLTTLQREMNRRFGLAAAQTLKAAQALYEQKLITYPRTDSRYVSSDMRGKVPEILDALRPLKPEAIAQLDLKALPLTGRIVNDAKVSDHHAIIPTGKNGSVDGAEAKVYEAIVTQFIAAFYPPCVKEITVVDAVSAEVPFRARGVRILEPGWSALFPKPKKRTSPDSDGDEEQPLPEFKKGESGPHKPIVHQGETQPPQPFTEGSLLALMETAGKLVDDETLKEALKERGLGTPATRAAIIETLLTRGYIERQGNALRATDLGRLLIALVQDAALKSAELTGEWEGEMSAIQAGRREPEAFMAEIAGYTRELIAGSGEPPIDLASWGQCPRCGRPVIRGKRGWGCSGWRDGCSYVVWPEYEGTTLTDEQVRELLQRRRLTSPINLRGNQAILYISHHGHVLHVGLPQRDQQQRGGGKRGSKRGTAFRPRRKRSGPSRKRS